MIQRYEKILNIINIEAKREIRNQISLGEGDKKTLVYNLCVANKSEGLFWSFAESGLSRHTMYITIRMFQLKRGFYSLF